MEQRLGITQCAGILDVKIAIATEPWWKIRNQRVERLKSKPKPVTSTQPSDPSSSTSSSPPPEAQQQANKDDKYMPIQLYKAAAASNGVDELIGVVERISAEKGLTFSQILEQVSPLGNTLLHVAASHGNENNVRLIVYHSQSLVMKQNSVGDTALHLATRAGHCRVVSTLLRFQRDYETTEGQEIKLVRVKNRKGNTALHESVVNNEYNGVSDTLVEEDPELSYIPNNEGKSPLYLAIEAGMRDYVEVFLSHAKKIDNPEESRLKGKSPLLAAIMRSDKGLVDMILSNNPAFLNLADEEGKTPIHYAAGLGNMDMVQHLLGKDLACALERDKKGFFPVHMAAWHGHIQVIKELLSHFPDPREMVNNNGQNILHIAAGRGRHNVVSFILRTPALRCLFNEGDYDGNTPLHLATMNWNPKTVRTLTWDKRVDLGIVNNQGLTALDAAEYYMDRSPSFDKRLTWTALKAASAPRALKNEILGLFPRDSSESQPSNTDNYKDTANTLLVVATLVATVTFAAGFTMPGGYNSSDPNQGMATMLSKKAFYIFVFSDTIAMYSSLLSAISLIWAQLGDLTLVFSALEVAIPLLGLGLAMMSLAFMAGVYLVVSQLNWLAYALLIMGSCFLYALLTLFLPLCLQYCSGNYFFRYLTYYFFNLLILATVKTKDEAHG